MIQAIYLRNFKRFGDRGVTIPFAPLTLLLGQNSSGKSTVFQALLALQQTWEAHAGRLQQLGRLDLQGPRVRLGNFGNVVHGQAATRTFEIGLRVDSAWTYLRYLADARSPWASLRSLRLQRGDRPPLDLAVVGDANVASKLVLNVDIDTISTVIAPDKLKATITKQQAVPDRARPAALEMEVADVLAAIGRSTGQPGVADNLPEGTRHGSERAPPPIIECHLAGVEVAWESRGFPVSGEPILPVARGNKFGREPTDALLRLLKEHLDRTLFAAREVVQTLSHVGSARTPCPRVTELEADLDAECGSRGERAGSHLLANPWLETAVNNRFDQLKLRYRVAVRPMSETATATSGAVLLASALGQAEPNSVSCVQVSVEDVGYGIGQLLPLLVEQARLTGRDAEMASWQSDAEDSTGGSPTVEQHVVVPTLLVEQPELHLHPALQANVASILAGITQDDRKARTTRLPAAPQVIAETHSEHMVLRVQRLVRETRLAPGDVSIVFVSTRDDGTAHAEQIPLTQDGEFDRPWPGGFFPERYEEL